MANPQSLYCGDIQLDLLGRYNMASVRGYMDNPLYQKRLQRLRALNPNQKALLDTAMADRQFADAEMKKYLYGIGLEAELQGAEARLGLAERGMKLAEQKISYDISQTEKATDIAKRNLKLSALSSVGEGLLGLGEKAQRAKLTKMYMKGDE